MLTHFVDALLPLNCAHGSNTEKLTRVVTLAAADDCESLDELKTLIRDVMRLAPVVPGVYRKASAEAIVNGTTYQKGDRVYVAIKEAQETVSSGYNPG